MISADLLTIHQLNMHFGGIHALKDVSFSVKKNSITALIGPNGAGKTTLFNCLTGFYRATFGDVLLHINDKTLNIRTILGENFSTDLLIHPLDFLKWSYFNLFGGSHYVAKAGIARTFQTVRLFREMTVIENLLVAQHIKINRNIIGGFLNTQHYQRSENQAKALAFDTLEKCGLTNDANRLAGQLSYGKQRLLEIARCLCIQPILLCLDEPAAGLNQKETEDLQHLIVELRQQHGLTIILIEHDMQLVMTISDEIIVLDQGAVISSGNPSIVRQDKRVIDAYLGIEDTA